MVAEIAVHYILSNTTAVTTLTGTTISTTRIYLGRRTQTKVMPAISIHPNGIEPTDQKPDSSGSGQGVSRLDVEELIVFCHGNTYGEASTLSQAVRTALDKKTGAIYNTVNVQSIQFLGEDYFDEETDPATYIFEHRYRLRIIR